MKAAGKDCTVLFDEVSIYYALTLDAVLLHVLQYAVNNAQPCSLALLCNFMQDHAKFTCISCICYAISPCRHISGSTYSQC